MLNIAFFSGLLSRWPWWAVLILDGSLLAPVAILCRYAKVVPSPGKGWQAPGSTGTSARSDRPPAP